MPKTVNKHYQKIHESELFPAMQHFRFIQQRQIQQNIILRLMNIVNFHLNNFKTDQEPELSHLLKTTRIKLHGIRIVINVKNIFYPVMIYKNTYEHNVIRN